MAAESTSYVGFVGAKRDKEVSGSLREHAVEAPTVILGSKPKHPRAKARYNPFSRLFFCWLDPLFCLGLRRGLEQKDLYAHPPEADSDKLLRKFNGYWNKEIERKRRGAKAHLWWAIVKCFWWWILLHGVALFIQMLLLTSQAVYLGYTVEYFGIDSPTDEETRNAYLFATGLVVAALFVALNNAHIFLQAAKVGMMTRIMATAAIYQKILRLSQVTISQESTGRVINLASNDVQRFDLLFTHYHYVWMAPLQWVIATFLIYNEVGWSAFLAIGYLLLQAPFQICLSRLFTRLRFKSARVTDYRVKVMNEVISGIRIIKMYAWEYAFKRVVTKLRRKEAAIIFQSLLVRGTTIVLSFVLFYLILMFLIFVPFVETGGELSNKGVFTTIALLYTVRQSLHNCTNGILEVSEGFVGIARIQRLLELDEIADSINDLEAPSCKSTTTFSVSPMKEDETWPFIKVLEFSTSWSYDREKLDLENISFTMRAGSHILAVVGPVGSGKSTLLQCILRELQPLQGTIQVCGKVSYSSQEPWVFSGTLRENVLFGLPFQRHWYIAVMEACALDKDIEQLVDGDLTLVGERGVTLSGGQKARVTLARAVYRNADIYLLDDPLSAVDTAVCRHLFQKVICGLLSDKLVVLVTHQVQFARQATILLAIRDGKVEACGSHEELVLRGIDPSKLLGLKEEEGEDFTIKEEAISTVSIHSASDSNKKQWEFEEEPLNSQPEEEKALGSISLATYYRYFRAGGGYLVLFTVLVITLIGEVSFVLPDWWIADWVDCSTSDKSEENNTQRSTCQLSTNQRVEVYAGSIAFAIFTNFARTVLMFYLMVNASRVLHNRMFASILRAPILFFDTNPSGRVLNRFSKDVGFLDDLLPQQFYEYLILVLRFIVILLVACIANYWIIIPAAILVTFFVIMRWYYLKTSREIKRLEAIARSPLYSHISATLQGLSTIRTFGEESVALSHFHKLQNEHTQGWYLYLVSSRWFGIRLDTMSALFVAAVAFISLPLASTLNAGLAGLGLAYAISIIDSLQYLVRLSAEVENLMVSVERLLQYGELESEAPLETLPPQEKPPSNWPADGGILMYNVSFRFADNLPLVLNNLTFVVAPSEKIGIVGRTGAGKSSLLSVLFRIAESSGVVTIDGVVSRDIGLHDLRRNISIIPQDPVLFSGTMRYNLDPFDEYGDEALWAALEQVQLKSVVESLEGRLHGEVSERGTNFSVGQRQLVCLARALLKKNKILVLDEATANVDIRTDGIIQKALREQFSNCTVLTIAHRLNTIMDSDRILVMHNGQVKEFDSPYALLHDPRSQLKMMVEQTGHSASRKLYQMAVEAHQRRQGEVSKNLDGYQRPLDFSKGNHFYELVTPL